ncbi:hypothetical protein PPTG_15849 [Phytophthora nicotianae INRA-310]|uniref:Uncharacterized protein n=1 Tax=Phytophthora nicotianae (strain INRA-310) TaxID=761204 RepID=W2PQI9_PHYN3|nr:hypothetical protein PPTG_15849 [Phytophthora nicotianae INRA-310]ETN02896.1 hypothetical protein PPTG_15849 [Phytophthora nicotianae INRA-310]
MDYEAAAGFSSQERALLRQVQTEQKLARRNWSECPLVTTLMYNIVVSSNSNQRLKLRRWSFATLAPKINSLTIKPTPGTKESTSQRLFRFVSAGPCSEITPREQELLAQLFSALRRLDGVRKRRQVFVMVYDFASCVCTGIHPKPGAALLAKWNNMKQQANNAKLKLKFKLSPEMKAIISSSRSDSENGGQISHFRSCSASISSSTVGMNYFNATNAHSAGIITQAPHITPLGPTGASESIPSANLVTEPSLLRPLAANILQVPVSTEKTPPETHEAQTCSANASHNTPEVSVTIFRKTISPEHMRKLRALERERKMGAHSCRIHVVLS